MPSGNKHELDVQIDTHKLLIPRKLLLSQLTFTRVYHTIILMMSETSLSVSDQVAEVATIDMSGIV